MVLYSGEPFWPINSGPIATAPPIDRDVQCDAVVIGAGITGALIAESLCRAGVSTVTIDRRDVVAGSTSASTALLLYDLDIPLVELAPQIGDDEARRAYRISAQAIDELERTGKRIGCPVTRRPALFLARDDQSWELLRRENEARRSAGLDSSPLQDADLRDHWGIQSYRGALLSRTAAEMDPYRFAHALLETACRLGGRTFDRTTATKLDLAADSATVHTDRGPVIRAGWVILACGYETGPFLPSSGATLRSTYALVTEPVATPAWLARALIWEHGDPYIYARTTDDGRVMIGGEDEPFADPAARDALMTVKTRALMAKLRSLAPGHDFRPAYSWAATFGQTDDALGYIGPPTDHPRLLCAAGLGGNGINISAVAARIITSIVMGRPDEDQHLFRFAR